MTGVEVVRVVVVFAVPGGPLAVNRFLREVVSVERVRWSTYATEDHRGRAGSVTGFGNIINSDGSLGDPSNLTWYPGLDEIPAWVPRPPAWFYTALDASADALQQPERGRPLAECARCGRKLYAGDYLCCPDPLQPVNL